MSMAQIWQKISQNTSLCEYHTSEKQNLWSSGILPRQKIAGKKIVLT